jgi:large subunit ribosomal protein L18
MNGHQHTVLNRKLRKQRVRSVVHGTTERPRLTVHISSRHITAQLVDDAKQQTLAHVTTVSRKDTTGTLTEQAAWVGGEIAAKAKVVKVKRVVFDRGSRLYHGRIKALADAARENGLEF